MAISSYQQLDKFIAEYEEDSKLLKSDRIVMSNYHKSFLMSVVSLFEVEIKNRLRNFCDYPDNPIQTHYQDIHIKMQSLKPYELISDKLYALLRANNINGIETLDASPFYTAFGGIAFKALAENTFNVELATKIADVTQIVNSLNSLIGTGEKFDAAWVEKADIQDKLNRCTFNTAENAFLSLKLRRNKIAHNYINGISDTFYDIRDFYYDAVLYVSALEKIIGSKTNIP